MLKLKNIFFLFIVSCILFGCTIPVACLIDNDFLKKVALNDKELEYAKIYAMNTYGCNYHLYISFDTNDSLIVIPSLVSVYYNREKLSNVGFCNFNGLKQDSALTVLKDNKGQYVMFTIPLCKYISQHLNELQTKDTLIVDLSNVIWKNNNPIEIEKLIIIRPRERKPEYKEKRKILKQEIKYIFE